ncbi:MAG: hypothetical protein JF616_19540 [Fibrobacteres bacterium]|nr:hypothetical protein [Fibrobacterota bacterium]
MRFPGILLAAAIFGGCFTEVGNAGDDRLLEAQFSVDYSQPVKAQPKRAAYTAPIQTATILRFYLGVREAEFQLFDSATNQRAEYHLWKEDTAVLPVDFTGHDPAASLPDQKVSGIDPLSMKLECVLPVPKTLSSTTLNFGTFTDPGYIKGVMWDGRDSTAFLFALPSGSELSLAYPKSIIETWYSSTHYRCQFIFYANKWIAAADLSAAEETPDVTGRKVILLDASHNAAAFAALTTAFSTSFNAPNVYLETHP